MDDALDDGTRRRKRFPSLKKASSVLAVVLAVVVCFGGLIGAMYGLPDDLLGDYSTENYDELPVGVCIEEPPADRSPQILDCASGEAVYRVTGMESGGVRGLDAMTEDEICRDVEHDRKYRHRERAGAEVVHCLEKLRP